MAIQQLSSTVLLSASAVVGGLALLAVIAWPPGFWLCGVGAILLGFVVSVASIGRRRTVLLIFWVPKDDPPLAQWQSLLALFAIELLITPLLVILVRSLVQ